MRSLMSRSRNLNEQPQALDAPHDRRARAYMDTLKRLDLPSPRNLAKATFRPVRSSDSGGNRGA